jgi:hypothetical protein
VLCDKQVKLAKSLDNCKTIVGKWTTTLAFVAATSLQSSEPEPAR